MLSVSCDPCIQGAALSPDVERLLAKAQELHQAQKEQKKQYGCGKGAEPGSQIAGSSDLPLSAVLMAIDESRAALGVPGSMEAGPQRRDQPQQGEIFLVPFMLKNKHCIKSIMVKGFISDPDRDDSCAEPIISTIRILWDQIP